MERRLYIRLVRLLSRVGTRLRDQLRGALLLREATDALEAEDFDGAQERFLQVLALDAPAPTRLMGYHGSVITLLRLGRYHDALSQCRDARQLLCAWPADVAQDEEIGALREALDQAEGFARWALEHPYQASELRARELELREEAEGAPPVMPTLGRASTWPDAARVGYRLLVHGLVVSGLLVASIDRGEIARKVLLAAQLAARFDRRLERDVFWHLCRIDEQLGRDQEAEATRARYEELNSEVRSALRRRRWTN